MIDFLDNDNLIICPNELRKSVIMDINKNSKLVSYKVMDLKEFLQNYFFSYDKRAIFYLMKKLNLKYEIALEYLGSFYYLENKSYDLKKLNDLALLKKELESKNLLISNALFRKYLGSVNIIIYGYYDLEPFYKNIFSGLKVNYVINQTGSKKNVVYEFNSIDDEVAYLCHDIKKKIDSGISINDIKIVKPSSEYLNILNRIFKWCHIPIDLRNKVSLYDLPSGKELLMMIKNNNNFDTIILELEDKIDKEILNYFINILNEYVLFECNVFELYDLIKYDLMHTYLSDKRKNNCVTICNLEELTENDYAYLIGFNKENYPKIYKDEDILSDEMKRKLGLFTSNDNNINSLNKLKTMLSRDINLTITYKLKTAFDSYNPSLIIKEEEYDVIKDSEIKFDISNFYNEMMLAIEYDKYYKYGVISNTLEYLMPNYRNLNYRSYNNQFSGINSLEFLNSLNNHFTLSYSTIDQYYRCSFRYYISNILKIKEDKVDEFYMQVGNIFHYVLSKCFDDNFIFDEAWNFEANKYQFTFNKLILLEKLKQELKYDIEIINKHKKYSYFDSYLYEKRFSIPIKNDKGISSEFVGIVDKICYLKEDSRTLVSVIDYKTGSLPSNLCNIIYGIGMQLPVYLYFIKRSSLFPNLEIVGFYLQKIINKEMKETVNKTLDELKENALKLVGYSTDNEEILQKFDMTYEDSQMINSLKKKKEGFYAFSKILSDKQMINMDKLVEEKIESGVKSILDGEFLINPKKIGKDLVGCEFCSYKDICFKKESDYVELEKHNNLDFLGGDNNA